MNCLATRLFELFQMQLMFFFSGQRMKDIKCHEDSWLRSWGRSKVITGDEPGGGKPKSEFICGKFPLVAGW